VETKQRFSTLAKGEVDILFAATTNTLERQVFEPTTQQSFSFSTPYLHNGVIFAGRPDYVPCADNLNVTSGGLCQDTKICVLDGTTHREVVGRVLPDASVVIAPTFDSLRQIFMDGGCNVLAGEQFELFFDQDELLGDYVFGSNVHSKEPLALVTRDDDHQFSSFCNWIVQSLFSAEEVRNSGSATSLSDLPTPSVFGEQYEFMFQDAFAVVGDYDQIYKRHLERYVPRSAANRINMGDSPAMFPIPFGNLKPDTVPNISGGTLESIRHRGHLRCGITQAAIFAEFKDGEWSGLDVSFCEALSAAIFDGAIHVRYTVLGPTDRFVALQEGRVDVLARVSTITMERDVSEPTTGKGFTFSTPNFHDEIRFAGVPP
jgi:ABC-type amino acid transport substrate-binding protein